MWQYQFLKASGGRTSVKHIPTCWNSFSLCAAIVYLICMWKAYKQFKIHVAICRLCVILDLSPKLRQKQSITVNIMPIMYSDQLLAILAQPSYSILFATGCLILSDLIHQLSVLKSFLFLDYDLHKYVYQFALYKTK